MVAAVEQVTAFIPESGPLGNISLHNISQDELISMHGRNDALTTAVRQQNIHDKRRNHLNEENNKLLANLIIDIIIKDDFTCQPIKMQDTFNLVGEYIDFHIYNNEN